jgi:hypothetical protein
MSDSFAWKRNCLDAKGAPIPIVALTGGFPLARSTGAEPGGCSHDG